jgi:hypothetical protein
MGVVYKAWHMPLKRLVALKMVLVGELAGRAERARFRTEAEAVARLQHPNVVQIYEVGEAGGRPFCALEFAEGGSLDEKLRGTPLPAREAAQLAEALARAVQAAHERGIVHRDLKPGNILLQRRPEAQNRNPEEAGNKAGSGLGFRMADFTPKVTDFGLAKWLDSSAGQTQSGAILGTPGYMAPEQAGGKSCEVGPPADVYALGAVLYECLTGRPPFQGTDQLAILVQVTGADPVPPARLNPGVPRDLETICLKCLEKEPAKRYPSAQELAEELARFRRAEPIRARPVGPVERLRRWARRQPALAAAAGLILLTLVGAAVVSTLFAVREAEARALSELRNRLATANARVIQEQAEDALRDTEAELVAAKQALAKHRARVARQAAAVHAAYQRVDQARAQLADIRVRRKQKLVPAVPVPRYEENVSEKQALLEAEQSKLDQLKKADPAIDVEAAEAKVQIARIHLEQAGLSTDLSAPAELAKKLARLRVQEAEAKLRVTESRVKAAERPAALHPVRLAEHRALVRAAQSRLASAQASLAEQKYYADKRLASKVTVRPYAELAREQQALLDAEQVKLKQLQRADPAVTLRAAQAEAHIVRIRLEMSRSAKDLPGQSVKEAAANLRWAECRVKEAEQFAGLHRLELAEQRSRLQAAECRLAYARASLEVKRNEARKKLTPARAVKPYEHLVREMQALVTAQQAKLEELGLEDYSFPLAKAKHALAAAKRRHAAALKAGK